MSLAVAVAAALFVGLVAYALFGGADFGSGYFDLTAGSARAGAELRTQVDHSIGPVWEANHVWLIYVLVIWWTGFPESFAAAMTTLILPMLLALLGIVLRGAAFAFRKYAGTLEQARVFGAVFAGSSLITPFGCRSRGAATCGAPGSTPRRWSAVSSPSGPACSWPGCSWSQTPTVPIIRGSQRRCAAAPSSSGSSRASLCSPGSCPSTAMRPPSGPVSRDERCPSS
jgi:hypothetical protein